LLEEKMKLKKKVHLIEEFTQFWTTLTKERQIIF
jgi:hypothetical protein